MDDEESTEHTHTHTHSLMAAGALVVYAPMCKRHLFRLSTRMKAEINLKPAGDTTTDMDEIYVC